MTFNVAAAEFKAASKEVQKDKSDLADLQETLDEETNQLEERESEKYHISHSVLYSSDEILVFWYFL